MPFRYLQLSFAPVGLDEPDDEGAPTRHRFRPVEPPGADVGRPPPPWLADLPQRATVYATLGTVYNGTDLLTAIVDGLEHEDLNLVVTVGATQDPARFGHRPENVRIERWIPQHVLLPHCAAVVTHGGYGTVSAALSAGVPVVCVPISADQPINAARCAALGVGVVVPPDDRTPDAIRGATRAVLDDHHHRRVAFDSHRQPGLDHALDLLETLAGGRVPLVAPAPCSRSEMWLDVQPKF